MYPRYKVKEAKYFLNQLRGFKLASEEFCFNFSALIPASRSVTFTIQKLYKHENGFEEEYGKLKDKLNIFPFAKELIEARNISEKEGHKVPVLVTTIIVSGTNNKLTYECDPLPDAENDVIRQVNFEYGNDDEGWIPAELPENKRKELYMSHYYNAVSRMAQSNDISINYGIKLYEKGSITSISEFYEGMDAFLSTLEEAIVDFERKWPSTSLFSKLVAPTTSKTSANLSLLAGIIPEKLN